jgi:PAS domain S-box-containing protein
VRVVERILLIVALGISAVGVSGPWLPGTSREHPFLVLVLLLLWAVLRLAGALGQRRTVEREKGETFALLQGVIEGTSDAVTVKDARGRYLLINQAGARILGKTVEEVLGSEDAEIYTEDTSRRIQKGDLKILVNGQVQTTEEVRSIGGASRAYSVTRGPYRNARGEIAGIIAIARDITERKEAEELVRRQTEALTRALRLVAAEPALESLAEHAVRAVAKELRASFVSLFVLGGGHGGSEATAVDETSRIAEKMKDGDPLASGVASVGERDEAWRRVCASRAPLVVDRIPESPLVADELRFWASYHGLQTLLVVPLLWGSEVLGVVSVFSRERREFKPEEQELAQALVHLATLALQLTRMARERQASALAEERNRMAREIHDTLAQGFTGIIFQLEAALEVLEEDRIEGATHIDRALGQARSSLAEARRSVRELRPREPEGGDLARALRGLVEKSTGAGLPRLELSIQGAARSFSPEVEANLLKIAQEAVTNALKHAQARAIRVELTHEEWETTLSVRDDGRGFAPISEGPPGGYGLSLMRERAQFLQGRFELTSEPGAGTRVAVTVGVPPPEV